MIRRFVSSFLDVRKGEVLLTFLMFSYYYLVLVTYYLLKPARDSLFLVKLGAHQLPVVFILTAVIIAPITTLYSRASRSLQLNRLIYVTSAILVVNLIVLRWLLNMDASWVFYVFYIWVSIYGALAASQYWLFANAVYDPAQGKRLFALLNLGGILGAMTGGEVTALIIRQFRVATEDLLFFCLFFIVVFTFIVSVVWRMVLRDRREGKAPKVKSAKEEKRESFADMFAMIKRSRHLLYLVGIIALTMATASFVDYQFKTVSVAVFPEKGELTSFLGTFYSRLSLVSLILQVAFTYRILRLLGVTGIVMFLPLGLLFGSIVMFVFPGLVAAILLRGSDGAFRYSLDKTGRELLFMPIPIEVKKRTKVFIDVFVDRWFRGIAGAALLLFTIVLGVSVQQLSLVVIALLIAWLTMVILIRKEYVNTFRIALEKREIDPAQLTVNISDAAAVKALREALRSDNERDVVYALDVLSTVEDQSLLDDLTPILTHRSIEVRVRVMKIAEKAGYASLLPAIETSVRDEDPEIRLAALRFIALCSDLDPVELFESSIDGEPRVAATVLRYLSEKGTPEQRRRIGSGGVRRLLQNCGDGDHKEEIQVEVARAIGDLSTGESSPDIRRIMYGFLRDSTERVVGEALLSMGKTRDRAYLSTLIEALRDPRRRRFAREALVSFGDGVVGTLSDLLGDERFDIVIRRYIPVVMSRIPTQKSVDALSAQLTGVDASVRFRVIKALNSLRRRYRDLRFREDVIDKAFIDETRIFYEILQISSLQNRVGGSDEEALLACALDERLALNLERIFRLLGLHYPPKDVYSAYLGIVSTEKNRHASAIEFLDNVVGKSVKKYLFPIIDRVSETAAIKRGRELFGSEVETREEAVLRLIRGGDAWLRACALFCVKGPSSKEIRSAVADALDDPDPVVVETAKLALSRMT
jgi:AAA family ATP:ADP antiporter